MTRPAKAMTKNCHRYGCMGPDSSRSSSPAGSLLDASTTCQHSASGVDRVLAHHGVPPRPLRRRSQPLRHLSYGDGPKRSAHGAVRKAHDRVHRRHSWWLSFAPYGSTFPKSTSIMQSRLKYARLLYSYLFTADAGVGAGQKRPPRLSYSACSGPGGSRFANWANG